MSHTLPPEDLPPVVTTDVDKALQRQLMNSLNQHFFEACSGPLQAVIMQCQWKIRMAEVLTLVFHCPDMRSNWQVQNHITPIAERLAQFSTQAKVKVYPPSTTEPPLEMRVDERSVY
ncbi:MAG: hypothetical protein AAGB19_14920 [Cyanobacteria bacterium P01_F01_bin.3]